MTESEGWRQARQAGFPPSSRGSGPAGPAQERVRESVPMAELEDFTTTALL